MKEAVHVHRDGREVCAKTPSGHREYKSRTLAMADRQDWRCAICGLSMRGYIPTFDHENGRGMGGSKRDDRIEVDGNWQNGAAHMNCNGDKGSRHIPYAIVQPKELD